MKKVKKHIYPIDESSTYGEVLYGYTDIEEAKKDYKKLTGEDLDVDNCQFLRVELSDKDGEIYLSWKDQSKGEESIVCVY